MVFILLDILIINTFIYCYSFINSFTNTLYTLMHLLSTIMFLLYYSAALAASEVNKLYFNCCNHGLDEWMEVHR